MQQLSNKMGMLIPSVTTPSRVIDQLSDGLIFRRLFQAADFGRYDQFSDLAYTEAGEQCKATKFGRQVLLSFPSHSSKFRVLLHFADAIARRHSQAIT